MLWIERIEAYFGGTEKALLVGVYACLVLLLLLAISEIGNAIVGGIGKLKKAFRERKALSLKLRRSLQYTLPDNENSYVRARLNTALKPQEEEGLEKEEVGVRLGYVKKLLSGVKEAALSPVERLDVEEMASAVVLYMQKQRWSGSDVKAINEIFARLLKLSAKYEVAV